MSYHLNKKAVCVFFRHRCCKIDTVWGGDAYIVDIYSLTFIADFCMNNLTT